MSAPQQRNAITECGRMCERALAHAQENLDNGESQHAEEWLERAERWWSGEAFRQVAP
ncbi:hypothetical protein [Rhodanobacter lindaniclasticus]